MGPRVLYISNARLPTEKAHGFAITKMCLALGRVGARVELWHPRQGRSSALRDVDVFRYYGVPADFTVFHLPTLAIEKAKRLLPGRMFMVASLSRGLARSLFAAIRARFVRPDLCWTRDPTMMVCLVALGLPTVFEVHSIPFQARRRFISWASRRRALRGVITLTEGLKGEIAALGVPLEHIVAFPNAVDLNSFAAAPSRADARDKLDLPQDRPIVGYIGRFRTSRGVEKGLPDLIAAVGLLPASRRPLLLCVGGPAETIPFYETVASKAGLGSEHVRFVDHVASTDVPVWIRSCDICVVPWWDKPKIESPAPPLKLFEYMAAGIAVVTGDFTEIEHFVTDGVNGLVVPRRDPAALSSALRRLLADEPLREKLGAAAAHAARGYSWERRAEAGLRLGVAVTG